MMPKFLENDENVAELAQRLIAELVAARPKHGDNKNLAEHGRQATKKPGSGFITPRLTQQSTA